MLFDDRMPASDKQALLAAIRGEASQPLAVVIGAAAGLDVDGTLAKPLEQQRVSELIDECIAARLPKRVLIVDDTAAVRQVIQKVLKASRFRITAEEADGHAAACSRVTRQAFDVVILDCHMSGKDGFDTLEALLRIRPDAKILMTTERQDHTFADRARREGAAEFLYKPFFAGTSTRPSAGCSGSAICGGVEPDYCGVRSSVNSPLRMRLERLSAYCAAASSP